MSLFNIILLFFLIIGFIWMLSDSPSKWKTLGVILFAVSAGTFRAFDTILGISGDLFALIFVFSIAIPYCTYVHLQNKKHSNQSKRSKRKSQKIKGY